jgi:hypothetical protein
VGSAEPAQPRQQPARQERRCRLHRQPAATGAPRHRPRREVHLVQQRAQRREVPPPVAGQFHLSRAAAKQMGRQQILQQPNLVADCRGVDAQLLGRALETAAARRRLEGADRGQRRYPPGHGAALLLIPG